MKFLVYTRPRIASFFHKLADAMEIISDVEFCSDHKGQENISIMDYMYRAMRDIDKGTPAPADIPYDTIQRRCRYLRHLDPALAKRIIGAMWLGIERICDDHQPDYFFGMVMDSYVLDIIDRVMRRRGSQYLGFVNNMINGYSRLTARGELIRVREPENDEISQKISELRDRTYMPSMQKDFMWSTTPLSMFFTKFLKEWAKIGYYEAAKIIKRDPYNFYYNSVAAEQNMTCRSLGQLSYRRFGSSDWEAQLHRARAEEKTIIYFPLQFYPECSIDYWGDRLEVTAFDAVVQKVLDVARSSNDILVVMKEHPSASSLRKTPFYEKIAAAQNALLVDFDALSNDVIEQSDIVLTWTGSVGVEAVVRGNPLITFGTAYYDPGDLFPVLSTLDDIGRMPDLAVRSAKPGDPVDIEVRVHTVVKYMLSGLLPGYVFPLDYGSKKNPENTDRMDQLGESLSKGIRSLNGDAYPVRNGCL